MQRTHPHQQNALERHRAPTRISDHLPVLWHVVDGDTRGSIDRFHNRYKSPYLPANDRRYNRSRRALKSRPQRLNSARRKRVDRAIREVCEHRRWLLYAHNVRTTHVHVVVSIGSVKPGRALNAFKAYATRRMRQDGNWRKPHSPWADKGSKRRLWNERSLALAIDYVLYDQGDDPPDFDGPM
jgi:REP element-mobilizing transposase RayT